MICKNCNNEIPSNAEFCPICGQKNASQSSFKKPNAFGQPKGFGSNGQAAPETENYSAQTNWDNQMNANSAMNADASSDNFYSEDRTVNMDGGYSDGGFSGEVKAPKKKKVKSKKIIIASVCAVLVIAIVAVALVLIFGGDDESNFVYPKTYASVRTDRSTGEAKSYELYDGKKLVATLDDVVEERSSSDGSSIFYRDSSDTLYYFNGKNVQEVAQEVKDIVAVPSNGDFVYYYQVNEDEGKSYCRYDVNKKETKTFISEVSEGESYDSFLVSENGKYLTYSLGVYDKETYSTEYNYYMYNGSEISKIDEDDFLPISISNDGKSMYGIIKDDGKSNLYSIVNGEKTKVQTNVSSYTFNYLKNSVMILSDDYAYVSVDYKKAEKLFKCSGSNVEPCMPDDAVQVKDFRNMFWKSGDKIVYLDGDFKDTKIDDNVSSYTLTENGVLFYKDNNYNLYKVTAATKENPEKLVKNVGGYDVSENGDKVYFKDYTGSILSSEATLYVYMNGKKEKVMDDVDDFEVSPNGDAFALAELANNAGDLYYCQGTKSEKIASDVYFVTKIGDKIWYSDNYDSKEFSYDIYIQKSGKTFEKVKEEVYGLG